MTRPFAVRFESARPVRGVVPRGVAVGEADAFATRDDVIAHMDALDVAWGALAWSVNSFFKSRFASDVQPKDLDNFSAEQAKRLQQDTKWYLSFSKDVQTWEEFSRGHSTEAWWADKDLPVVKSLMQASQLSQANWQTMAGADYGIVPRRMLPGPTEEDSNFLLWASGAAVLGAGGFAAYKIHQKYFKKSSSEKASPAVSQDEDIVIETDEA